MAPTRRDLLGTVGGLGAVTLAGCAGGDGGGGQDATTTESATSTTTESGTTTTTTDGDTTPTTEDDGMSSATSVGVRTHSEYGDILVDGEGMTLYIFEKDEQGSGASTCYDSCAGAWPPLLGEPDADNGVEARLSTFERENGDVQVAANGWLLYYFASDGSSGDAKGQGIDGFGGLWWVLDPAGNPIEGSGGSDGDTTTTTEDDGPDY